MSTALLRKSLALCDPDIEDSKTEKSKQNKKRKELQARVTHLNKSFHIKSDKKLSVNEARQKLKQKDEILKKNLRLLRNSKVIRKIRLDEELTDKLIERAITRKPVSNKLKEEKVEETAFTEEDFKKFEAEYMDY